MKKFCVLILAFITIAVACVKKGKNTNCEFHRLEFVEIQADGSDIKTDKTILECLQLTVEDDFMLVANKAKTIQLKFSVSDENIVEEVDLDLDAEFKKSFDSVDEQEMELIEKAKTWEITIKSDNKSKFNGYIKLFKTSDGDYWKLQEKEKAVSAK
jgi:hypothetical protein